MADKSYQFDVELTDGTVLNAGTFTAPQGPQGIQGRKGDKGETGSTPTITMDATVDNTQGTATVNVVQSGTTESPSFTLNFLHLKGATGPKGDKGETGAAGAEGKQGVGISKITIKEVV